MGAPIAGHLAAAGHEVLALDPDPEAGAGLPEGVRRVAAEGDLATCDVVLVLAGGRAVPAVLLDGNRLRPVWRDRDVLVCSTVDPAEMRALHEAAARDGGRLLDAPLCRGDHGARRGDLLALVGGSTEVLDRCSDVLGAFCSDVVHIGAAGAGQVAKLVNNMLLWSTIAAVVEGMRLAEGLGVRRGPLAEGLRKSSADSWVLRTWDRPRELPWADEDMRLVLDAADRAGVPARVSDVVQQVIGDVRASGVLAEGGFGEPGWALPPHPDEPTMR
jgi:3-hydroxyisobutyrate dehydrogenase/2-hydroxy-3-oxopropionate reductase